MVGLRLIVGTVVGTAVGFTVGFTLGNDVGVYDNNTLRIRLLPLSAMNKFPTNNK